MNVQPILDRIEQDARADASAILEKAKKRAHSIEEQANEALQRAREEMVENARLQVLEQSKRMISMAELDARKEDLRHKRLLLDEAFSTALIKMNEMPAEKARAYGLSVLLSTSSGDEMVIASTQSPWCDEAFIKEANAALLSAGKKGQLALAQEQAALGSGGFLLRRTGMEMNCTYQAMVEMARPALEAEVAALLFS